MILDDAFPGDVYKAPPSTQDDAMRRISNLSGIVDGTCKFLTKLVGAKFKDMEQFRKAMVECGFNMTSRVIMDSGRNKTHLAKVIDKHGYEYRMITNETGDYLMEVVNVRLDKPGPGADPELIRQIRDGEKP